MAMPLTPFVSRSSTMRCCSAASAGEVSLNSTSTSVSSASAFSTPRRAIVQKSAELFVTNASLIVFAPPASGVSADRQPTVTPTTDNRQTTNGSLRDVIALALPGADLKVGPYELQ